MVSLRARQGTLKHINGHIQRGLALGINLSLFKVSVPRSCLLPVKQEFAAAIVYHDRAFNPEIRGSTPNHSPDISSGKKFLPDKKNRELTSDQAEGVSVN